MVVSAISSYLSDDIKIIIPIKYKFKMLLVCIYEKLTNYISILVYISKDIPGKCFAMHSSTLHYTNCILTLSLCH